MNVSVEDNKQATIDGEHREVVQKATSYNRKDTRTTTVENHDTRTLSAKAGWIKESVTGDENKSVAGCSGNSFTDNLPTVTCETISSKTDSGASIAGATNVVYKKGVVTEINGVE